MFKGVSTVFKCRSRDVQGLFNPGHNEINFRIIVDKTAHAGIFAGFAGFSGKNWHLVGICPGRVIVSPVKKIGKKNSPKAKKKFISDFI